MSRSQRKIPKYITDEFGQHPKIWSYSNISSVGGDNCSYEYYLSRILKLKGVNGIYGICGSLGHQQLEDFYDKKIEYKDMATGFESEYNIIELGEYKFHSDDATNNKRSREYKENLLHFFNSHEEIKTKVLTEVELWFSVNGEVFIAYVDAIHKDGRYIITDWKSSTYGAEYKGDKLLSKAHQILLYAYALHKLKNIPLDELAGRWCFMKHCKVDITYFIKSKKEAQHKSRICERRKWVDENKSQLKKDIDRFYPDLMDMERDILLEESIANNNLNNLCDEIKNNYKISDFYLDVDITQENIDELVEYVGNQIKTIKERGKDEANWEREFPISYVDQYGKNKDSSFYCNTLCGQKKNCKYYKQYIDDLKSSSQREADQDDIDLLSELDALM